MGRSVKNAFMDDEKKWKNNRKFFKKQFDIDIEKVYLELKDIGKIPANKYKDKEVLINAINEAANNAYKANMLYLKAKRECSSYRKTFSKKMRKLTRAAMQRIAEWLKEAEISSKKQITKDMVIEEICGDSVSSKIYDYITEEMEGLEEIQMNLECLAKQWNDRKNLLQSQARLIGG